MKTKTAAQTLIDGMDRDALSKLDTLAAMNGLTREQAAASKLINGATVGKHNDCLAILANKETAKAALDRIATVPARHETCHIDEQDLLAAIRG